MKINQIQALDFDIAYMDDAGYTCHKNIATCCLHLELTLHLGRNVAKTPRFYPCDVFKRCSLQICISEDTSLNEKSSVVAYCNAYELSSIVPKKKNKSPEFWSLFRCVSRAMGHGTWGSPPERNCACFTQTTDEGEIGPKGSFSNSAWMPFPFLDTCCNSNWCHPIDIAVSMSPLTKTNILISSQFQGQIPNIYIYIGYIYLNPLVKYRKCSFCLGDMQKPPLRWNFRLIPGTFRSSWHFGQIWSHEKKRQPCKNWWSGVISWLVNLTPPNLPPDKK